MPLATVVDIERLVSDYLRTHADIVALSTRIVGKTPESKTTSWVRVTELDSPDMDISPVHVESMVQLDCYAGATGGQPEVNTLARTVRAVLTTLPGTHPLGVVTGVRVQGGPRGLDTDLEPARDRKTLTAFIWNHA